MKDLVFDGFDFELGYTQPVIFLQPQAYQFHVRD